MAVLKWIRIGLIWFFFMPVVGISYFIAWLDRKVQFRLSFPRDLNQLEDRRDWCINQLKQGGAIPQDAQVTGFTIKPLNAIIIFRSNAGIITVDYTSKGVAGSIKCFIKFAPTMGTVWNKTVYNLQLNHIKEIVFNDEFVKPDITLPAPKVYCAKVSYISGHICLITEFMDGCIEYTDPFVPFPDAHNEMVLQSLALLHALYWNEKSGRVKKVLAIDDNIIYFFESMVARTWSADARKVMYLSWHHSNDPQTILHGDARVGNMLFPANEGKGRFVFIDWQAVRRGRAAFDLAYFIITSLPVEHRRRVEDESIKKYYEYLIAKGVKDFSFEQLREDYNHACLCVLALLSLPMLSGEVSAEGDAATLFAWGFNIWRERLAAKFSDCDYRWMSARYKMSEQRCRATTTEMVTDIEKRLDQIPGWKPDTKPVWD